MRIKRIVGGAMMCLGAIAVLYCVGQDWPLGVALFAVVTLAGAFLFRRNEKQ